MRENWQRIEQIIKWTGVASVSAFAREIGLHRSENLYQIKRGNNGISKDLAEQITTKYPQISKAWILTGEGTMLKEDKRKISPDIPYFELDATAYLQGSEEAKPSSFIHFPVFRECEFAAQTFSDAMYPEISRGNIIFFKKQSLQSLLPGETYLVISSHFNGIRIVRKDPTSSILRLLPKNKDNYDEIRIDCDDVEKLYLVRGIVTNKSV